MLTKLLAARQLCGRTRRDHRRDSHPGEVAEFDRNTLVMNKPLFYSWPRAEENDMDKSSSPADTRMMGIVHGALARDLARARRASSTAPYPQGAQRRALGAHVVWLMDFLHGHHTSEDEGLWPAVRAKNPTAGPLLDSLEADHRLIEPAAASLRTAGSTYAASSGDE